MECSARRALRGVTAYPMIARAVAEDRRRGCVPLLVTAELRAGHSDPPPEGRAGVEGTIDRLVTLSADELDSEIRRAGFDPAE